ncbi:MAG TPA: aryl-sulfate sulfotransferase [Rhodospirillaceae bacterium]|nr:aryl-sulfate sulfotransferase [Rhodospirillaceae bacterium]
MTETPAKPPSVVVKRSVLIAGHRTSISLESAFWQELTKIAKRRGLSINQLVAEIDAQRTGNLSSALRLYVLKLVKES